jgi:hypothetical protein
MTWLSKKLADAADSESLERSLILPTVQNSVHDFLERTAGKQISKVITLSASEATASVNIFQITGTVYIERLFAIVTTATTLVNCTAASFDLFPTAGAAVQISAATGVLSGVAVGTVITKTGLAADIFTVSDSVGAVVTEQGWAGSDVFNGFLVTQKIGVNTYVRFTYTTTDAPINAQLTVYAEYRGIGGGELIAA